MPFALRAQPRLGVGFISIGAPGPGNNIRVFFDALREQGFDEGRNLIVEMRFAGGSAAAIPALAAELAALPVDVIVADNNNVIVAAQQGLNLDRTPVEQAARTLGLQLHLAIDVSTAQDIEPAVAALQRAGANALLVWGGAVIYLNRALLVEAELRHRLPAMHISANCVRAGGLMSCGPDLREQYRRAAWYVARVLKGAKPAELPVEQPARFTLAINLKTARTLGLTVPRSLLLQADEVIE